MKKSNLAIVSVSEFQGKDSEADKNGLNPVMYVNKNCQFTDNFNKMMENMGN